MLTSFSVIRSSCLLTAIHGSDVNVCMCVQICVQQCMYVHVCMLNF